MFYILNFNFSVEFSVVNIQFIHPHRDVHSTISINIYINVCKYGINLFLETESTEEAGDGKTCQIEEARCSCGTKIILIIICNYVN